MFVFYICESEVLSDWIGWKSSNCRALKILDRHKLYWRFRHRHRCLLHEIIDMQKHSPQAVMNGRVPSAFKSYRHEAASLWGNSYLHPSPYVSYWNICGCLNATRLVVGHRRPAVSAPGPPTGSPWRDAFREEVRLYCHPFKSFTTINPSLRLQQARENHMEIYQEPSAGLATWTRVAGPWRNRWMAWQGRGIGSKPPPLPGCLFFYYGPGRQLNLIVPYYPATSPIPAWQRLAGLAARRDAHMHEEIKEWHCWWASNALKAYPDAGALQRTRPGRHDQPFYRPPRGRFTGPLAPVGRDWQLRFMNGLVSIICDVIWTRSPILKSLHRSRICLLKIDVV